MIASPTRPSPASANRQSTARDNKVRQLKSALDKLASDDVRLVALGQGRGRYERFQLNDEASSKGMAHDVPYTAPRKRRSPTVAIPASFFLNGWQHALTGSETLGYLALHELRRLEPTGHDRDGLRLLGAVRLASYGLSKDTYEDFQNLARFGLVDVVTDLNRREDGTFEDYSQGSQPIPNRYRLIDEGTEQLAVETVLAAL